MIDENKKIIFSDLIINDQIFKIDDDFKYPWQWVNNINHFFNEVSSSSHEQAHVIIDESEGPVFISESSIIEPFTILKGPLFIGKNTTVKSHSNISNSIINHDCKIKGEVHSSIFQPFSNKSHEGFIGHSFIGSWVNLGAGTTTSNLKNNYDEISVKWNGNLIRTGTIFFGAVIGEHVKTAIGTNLNSGSIIELGSNIVSQNFPPRFIPAFSFYYKDKISKINFDDFCKTATIAMKRREIKLSSSYTTALKKLYEKD